MLEVKNVNVSLGKTILSDISFKINDGDFLLILGPNGAGKTTLLKSITGIYDYQGTILIDGFNTKKLKRKELARLISYQPQREDFPLPLSVRDILISGRFPYKTLFHAYNRKDTVILNRVSDKFMLSNLLERDINTLSGGERKRVLIASAYVQDVKTFMFDEPLSSLDPKESLNIIKVLGELKSEGKTVIIVTHNISPFFRIKTKIVAIKNGKIVTAGDTENISSLLFKTFSINFKSITHSKGDIFIPDETE